MRRYDLINLEPYCKSQTLLRGCGFPQMPAAVIAAAREACSWLDPPPSSYHLPLLQNLTVCPFFSQIDRFYNITCRFYSLKPETCLSNQQSVCLSVCSTTVTFKIMYQYTNRCYQTLDHQF